MRFVAGRDAVAELLAGGTAAESYRKDGAGRDAVAELLARALQRRAIGKMLLAEALWRSTIGKMLLAGALWLSCC